MRRNPEYKERYGTLNEHPWGPELTRHFLTGEWGIRHGDELPDPVERPPLGEALTRAIQDEFGLSRLSTGVLVHRRLQKAMNAVSIALSDAKVDRDSIAGTLTLAYILDEDQQHRQRVTALDIRWSKKDLIETLEFWVDVFLADRAAAGLKQDRPQQRFRVTEYADYLRVHDLMEEGGKTSRDISKPVLSRSISDSGSASAYRK